MPKSLRPLFKDPGNLLIGVLIIVFLLGIQRHARPGDTLLDAMASMLEEMTVIALMGSLIGWGIKGVRSLWAQPPAEDTQPPAIDLPPTRPTVCTACEHPLRPGASFCTQCGTPVEQP